MTNPPPSSDTEFAPIEALRGALDWWREAGVDCDFTDEAQVWLEAPPSEQPAAKPPLPKPVERPSSALERAIQSSSGAKIGGEKASWPGDLAGFREFWLNEPGLDDGRTQGRVPPRGDAGAALMVLVGQPDEGDRDRLLAGPQGQVLSAILRATGLAEEALYFASALPVRTAMPDWAELSSRGLGELTRHHISLASPQRLLVFGRGLAGVLGCDLTAREHDGTPLMIAPSLDNLARSAGRRKRFWNNWLDWTA